MEYFVVTATWLQHCIGIVQTEHLCFVFGVYCGGHKAVIKCSKDEAIDKGNLITLFDEQICGTYFTTNAFVLQLIMGKNIWKIRSCSAELAED
jgi:hypothetical protein